SAIVCALIVTAPIAQAQSEDRDSFEEGLDLFSEGARRLMEELAGELGPLLLQLEILMDEITAYQAPEILENGDIIIRRKPDVPPQLPDRPGAEEDAPIDL
ncbi:MAG: AAA+ family ATPase, partial [Pseudomonadota bacterium]